MLWAKMMEYNNTWLILKWLAQKNVSLFLSFFRASMIFDPFYDMLQTRKKKATQAALN